MVSLDQKSVQFLVFLSILALVTALDPFMPVVFMNGLNVIRCSDQQLQVYQLPQNSKDKFDTVLECPDPDSIFDGRYTEFKWTNLNLTCDENNGPVTIQEEQFVETISTNGPVNHLPAVSVHVNQLLPLADGFSVPVDTNLGKIRIKTKLDDVKYFTETDEGKKRIIYLLFSNYKLICVITFPVVDENVCLSMNNQDVANAEHSCYYTPLFDHAPTVEEMQAEFAQLKNTKAFDSTKNSVLINLPLPVCPIHSQRKAGRRLTEKFESSVCHEQ